MFGIVSDESFENQIADLTKIKESIPNAKVVDIQRGRGNRVEVPSELRKIISEESIKGTPAHDLANLFGVSESSISAYKNDATSTASYNEPDIDLKKANDAVRDSIVTHARGRLVKALESITDEKLKEVKVKDAASIAKDMSAVIKNIEPNRDENKSFNQQIIFYAPKTRSESDFEMVEARE